MTGAHDRSTERMLMYYVGGVTLCGQCSVSKRSYSSGKNEGFGSEGCKKHLIGFWKTTALSKQWYNY